MKNETAPTPPMGWNSWDCYGASVNEEQLRGNAAYMAENLKDYGWEYIVCDIQWYEPCAKSTVYNAFYPLSMDEYSRLIPASNRFPSSANGIGFLPIAEYIHNLGLKFGIHIMRGIPRQAVHMNTHILGSTKKARDIAHTFSLCPWNTDMYGVNPGAEGAQEYYDSIFSLYAAWGVDFVKVDDICNTEFKPYDPYSAAREIEMIRAAIDHCGRKMVLSLSPGPAPIEHAEHLRKYANMWRLTGDFWDNWNQLKNMFEKCRVWNKYTGEGCWPDCDMLPLGRIAINNDPLLNSARYTNFTHDEQITLMTLWCIFRSPLMLGCELRELDDWTLKLITNEEVLRLTSNSHSQCQLVIDNLSKDCIVWKSTDSDGGANLAFFNTGDEPASVRLNIRDAGLDGEFTIRDLWARKDSGMASEHISVDIAPHGAKLFKLSK